MRVLVAGCRSYTYDIIIDALIAGLPEVIKEDVVIVNGQAPGADVLADDLAKGYGIDRDPYPADWDKYGKAAGPIRNKQMLDEGKPDIVVAFLDRPEEDSKGTRNMIKQAEKAKLPVFVIERRLPVEGPEQLTFDA